MWGGVGLLVCVVLALVLPVGTDEAPLLVHRRERSHYLAGAVLIVLGAALLAGNQGWAPWLTWSLFWPVVLIVVGGALLQRSSTWSVV